jgi:hypothetical protein
MSDSLYNWDKHVIHWQNYRKFFNIHIFRYLVLWFSVVPVLVKVLNSIITFLSVKLHYSPLQHELQLPISWELLWLSSFFFVIAFLVYLLRCPRFVREYDSYSVYKEFGHSPRWLVWLSKDLVESQRSSVGKFVERLIEKKYLVELKELRDTDETCIEVRRLQTQLVFDYLGRSYILAMPLLRNDEIDTHATTVADQEIFWEIYGRYASSRLRSRQGILVFLSLAAVFFSIVLVQNIAAGLTYILW